MLENNKLAQCIVTWLTTLPRRPRALGRVRNADDNECCNLPKRPTIKTPYFQSLMDKVTISRKLIHTIHISFCALAAAQVHRKFGEHEWVKSPVRWPSPAMQISGNAKCCRSPRISSPTTCAYIPTSYHRLCLHPGCSRPDCHEKLGRSTMSDLGWFSAFSMQTQCNYPDTGFPFCHFQGSGWANNVILDGGSIWGRRHRLTT